MFDKTKITTLIGVYDADATILGEISYWLGARFGIRQCTLCDITHSLFFKKLAWEDCQRDLEEKHGVVFKAFHRNDQPEQVRRVINGHYPAVVAQDISSGYTLFMCADEISQASGSPEVFLNAIIQKLPK